MVHVVRADGVKSGRETMNHLSERDKAERERRAAPPTPRCSCGARAVWRHARPTPENAPEHVACFLTDADFADDYCASCFARAVSAAEQPAWTRLSPADVAKRTHGSGGA
jgi:hypothetical protein